MMVRGNLLAMSARDRRPFVYSQRRSIAREEFSKAGQTRLMNAFAACIRRETWVLVVQAVPSA